MVIYPRPSLSLMVRPPVCEIRCYNAMIKTPTSIIGSLVQFKQLGLLWKNIVISGVNSSLNQVMPLTL